MTTLEIVFTIIGVVIALAIIGGLVYYFCFYKKKQNKPTENIPVQKPETKPENKEETIQLIAVKKLKGTNPFGLESDKELADRLSKLNKAEFVKLDIKEYPLTKEGWVELANKEGEEAVYARNTYEMGIYFAYNGYKELKEANNPLLRTFK